MNAMVEDVRNLLVDIIEEPDAIDHFKISDGLLEWGINSIDFIKLVVAIETKYGIKFDDDSLDLQAYDTMESFIAYIQSKISKA